MELVQQRGSMCGLACLAMVQEITLDQVLKDLNKDESFDGATTVEMMVWLHNYGFDPILYSAGTESTRPNQVYIVAVPSLNNEGLLHYIVGITGNSNEWVEILDPNNGRKNMKFYGEGGNKHFGVCEYINVGEAKQL